MERELEGEQKYSGEQKNIDKANTKSKKQTKKRTKNRAQQQTESYKVFISFLFNCSYQTKEREQGKSKRLYLYIIQRKAEAKRKSKRGKQGSTDGGEEARQRGSKD